MQREPHRQCCRRGRGIIGGGGRRCVAGFAHVRHEAIPSPRDRRDAALVIRIVGQDPPDGENLLTEICLLDGGVRPHDVEELVLPDRPAAPLDERQQDVEGLAGDRNGAVVAGQHTASGIEAEWPEQIPARGGLGRA